jgi:hypothetical protein
MAPFSGHNPWAALDPTRLRRILRLGTPIARFVETRKAASRHSGPATSRPYRWCIQLRVQSSGSPCRSQPKARSEPAAADSSSSAPNDRDRRAPPSSKCQVSLQGCRSCILESRLIHQR